MQVMTTIIRTPSFLPSPPTKRYWRISQLMAWDGWPWSEKTTRRMIYEGQLKFIRRGPGHGCILIPDEEVQRLTSAQCVTRPDQM
jgi:hypothetical protein